MASNSSRPSRVRLGIIGTGGMARQHAKHFREIAGCKVVAAMDVDAERVDAFCAAEGVAAAYTDVGTMLAEGGVDACAIVTPDAFHAPVAIECLQAGKHVLCEKPLAVNYADAQKMLAAAREAGVVHMVNFSYRSWSSIQAVAKLVHAGEIGEIRHVEASYLQSWLVSKAWGEWRSSPGWLWRLSTAHGSKGVLGDVGVHIVDFASFPVGPIKRVFARLQTFAKAPGDRIGEYSLDANDSAVLAVEFANGALGSIHATRWGVGHTNRLHLKIAGTLGAVEIDSERSESGYRWCSKEGVENGTWHEVTGPAVPNNYARFITSVQTGVNDSPDFARGAEIQKVLDACFESDALGKSVEI